MNYFIVHDDDDLFVFREQTASQIIKFFCLPSPSAVNKQAEQRKKHEIARFSFLFAVLCTPACFWHVVPKGVGFVWFRCLLLW